MTSPYRDTPESDDCISLSDRFQRLSRDPESYWSSRPTHRWPANLIDSLGIDTMCAAFLRDVGTPQGRLIHGFDGHLPKALAVTGVSPSVVVSAAVPTPVVSDGAAVGFALYDPVIDSWIAVLSKPAAAVALVEKSVVVEIVASTIRDFMVRLTLMDAFDTEVKDVAYESPSGTRACAALRDAGYALGVFGYHENGFWDFALEELESGVAW